MIKVIIAQLIDDFHERKRPALVARHKKIVQIPGKANVVIGMRRTGNTNSRSKKVLTTSLLS